MSATQFYIIDPFYTRWQALGGAYFAGPATSNQQTVTSSFKTTATLQTFDQSASDLGFPVGRRRGLTRGGRALVHDRDLDDCFLRVLADDLDVDVAAALLELDQRGVYRLIERSAAAYGGLHVPHSSIAELCSWLSWAARGRAEAD